jgi:hypothetical protein
MSSAVEAAKALSTELFEAGEVVVEIYHLPSMLTRDVAEWNHPFFEHNGIVVRWLKVRRIELHVGNTLAMVTVIDEVGPIVVESHVLRDAGALVVEFTPEQDAQLDALSDGEEADRLYDELYDAHPDVVAARAANEVAIESARATHRRLVEAWGKAL